jgi:hypothetical protein
LSRKLLQQRLLDWRGDERELRRLKRRAALLAENDRHSAAMQASGDTLLNYWARPT